LLTLSGHKGDVKSVAWSPEGRHLAVSRGGIVQIYIMDIALLMAFAHTRVTRNLTLDECRKFLHMDEVPPIRLASFC
jgi:WD40 repeat protein